MSSKAFPFLYINMGGEMMYILHERLKAQKIPNDKTKKVLYDIITVMFNTTFMEDVCQPQDLWSKKALRAVFDRLAHSSIMRLNTTSMDKLYDLMTMAVKYQVTMLKRPQDILLVTFNHLDVLRTYVMGSALEGNLVENVYRLLRKNYGNLNPGAFMLIRQTVLGFFQDVHVRVSIFLREKVQTHAGRFVLQTSGQMPVGFEVPGKIRLFNSQGVKVKELRFNCGGSYSQGTKEGSLELVGDRVITLGTNMYSCDNPLEAKTTSVGASAYSDQDVNAPDLRAKAQLDLLSQLIGVKRTTEAFMPEFKMTLFSKEEEDDDQPFCMTPTAAEGSNFITIDASKRKESEELRRIMNDLNIESTDDSAYSENLLDLMDSAK